MYNRSIHDISQLQKHGQTCADYLEVLHPSYTIALGISSLDAYDLINVGYCYKSGKISD